MTEFQRALINFRLAESRESLEEAKVLLREKMSNRSVTNRLYYAMFYAVLALLQDKQLGLSKHSGVIAVFDREFVKKKIFDKKLSKALHRAFELRQKGDYMENAAISDSDIEELMQLTIEFLYTTEKFFSTR